MKIYDPIILIDKGDFSSSRTWQRIHGQVVMSIQAVKWPKNSDQFCIFPGTKGNRLKGIPDTLNGVKPIKDAFVSKIVEFDDYGKWHLERRADVATRKTPGKIDAVFESPELGDRLFAVEWETGNISSSHRAINKMALGLLKGILIGGLLIVPTRDFYKHLTDRVGNLSELEPYFDLWRNIKITDGFLAILPIEQDAVSTAVPRIDKGTDGRALV